MDDEGLGINWTNILMFPVSREQKIERVAKAMADSKDDHREDAWLDYVDAAITALKKVNEIKF